MTIIFDTIEKSIMILSTFVTVPTGFRTEVFISASCVYFSDGKFTGHGQVQEKEGREGSSVCHGTVLEEKRKHREETEGSGRTFLRRKMLIDFFAPIYLSSR